MAFHNYTLVVDLNTYPISPGQIRFPLSHRSFSFSLSCHLIHPDIIVDLGTLMSGTNPNPHPRIALPHDPAQPARNTWMGLEWWWPGHLPHAPCTSSSSVHFSILHFPFALQVFALLMMMTFPSTFHFYCGLSTPHIPTETTTPRIPLTTPHPPLRIPHDQKPGSSIPHLTHSGFPSPSRYLQRMDYKPDRIPTSKFEIQSLRF